MIWRDREEKKIEIVLFLRNAQNINHTIRLLSWHISALYIQDISFQNLLILFIYSKNFDNLHVNIIILHIDIINVHVDIHFLHVDLIYLTCKGQIYATIYFI